MKFIYKTFYNGVELFQLSESVSVGAGVLKGTGFACASPAVVQQWMRHRRSRWRDEKPRRGHSQAQQRAKASPPSQ